MTTLNIVHRRIFFEAMNCMTHLAGELFRRV
jgi:hypothetical protein